MTKLERLKDLNAKRTKGVWRDWIEFRGAKRSNVIALANDPSKSIGSVNVEDSEFIAELANSADDLLAIVEAAKVLNFDQMQHTVNPCPVCNFKNALQKFEAANGITKAGES